VRTRTGPTRALAFAALTSCAAVQACSADLLFFGAVPPTPPTTPTCDSTTPPWASWSSYGGTYDPLRIEDLPYGAAYDLCTWIDQNQNPCSQPSVAAGYAGGPTQVCTVTSSTGVVTSLAMVWLGVDDCVANLQHAPCAASVSDLVACVDYFGEHAGDLDCASAAGVCSLYESASGCDETVIQANPDVVSNGPLAAECAVSLPIVPGVTCLPEPADAGDEGDDGALADAAEEGAVDAADGGAADGGTRYDASVVPPE
jgi:hypothetical protein